MSGLSFGRGREWFSCRGSEIWSYATGGTVQMWGSNVVITNFSSSWSSIDSHRFSVRRKSRYINLNERVHNLCVCWREWIVPRVISITMGKSNNHQKITHTESTLVLGERRPIIGGKPRTWGKPWFVYGHVTAHPTKADCDWLRQCFHSAVLLHRYEL